MVGNVHVTSVKSTEISLAWDAPNDPDNEIEMYEVRKLFENLMKNIHCIVIIKQNFVLWIASDIQIRIIMIVFLKYHTV